MQKLPISATIIVKNAQSTIGECLQSLSEFDEVILLDSGSSDDTLTIAKSFSNVRVFYSEFIGFGALKNLAVSYAKNDWVLSIDSDEILEEMTKQTLATLPLQTNTIYALPRKNLYNGEWIKACGWYPDYVWRLFNKNFTHFNDNIVHESVIIPKDAQTLKLQSGIKHYAYESIYGLLEKMQYYSNLWAEQNLHRDVSMGKSIFRGCWSFFRSYFLKKGIFYGYKGFIISFCNALGTFFKYAKLYELKYSKPTSCSLIITTYNQKERLALVLDSVKNLMTLPNEVLIADDGSKEDTKELIEQYQKDFPCPLLHIWQEDKGFCLSAIRNKAIKKAQSQYIIIIDGDMVLEPHFIDDHLDFARHKVFLQGSRIILDNTKTSVLLESKKLTGGGIKTKRHPLLSRLIYQNSVIRAEIFEHKDLIKGIRGCNMSFYKSDCEAINGFNESFIGWGREDSEFVARFLFNGGQMRRLKFAGIAYHLYHPENVRDMLESNHKIYLDTISSKKTFCENGLVKKTNNPDTKNIE